jgi:hypothetical protein
MTDTPLPPDAPVEPPLPESIGVAHMRDDGTIEMHLRAEAADGSVGEAMFIYAPDDLRYDSILAHVGPMSPGDQVAVKPFSA